MNTKRFNLINDEWLGLDGAEYLIAIEDSDSPKKTVYFAYIPNAKGICDLLNNFNDENKQLKQKIINMEQAEDDVINFFKIHENRFDIHMKDEIEKEFGDVFDD